MFVLTPIFPLIPFLLFDFLDQAIGLAWFTVNPFQPWGVIWDISLIRIGLLALLLILATQKGSLDKLQVTVDLRAKLARLFPDRGQQGH